MRRRQLHVSCTSWLVPQHHLPDCSHLSYCHVCLLGFPLNQLRKQTSTLVLFVAALDTLGTFRFVFNQVITIGVTVFTIFCVVVLSFLQPESRLCLHGRPSHPCASSSHADWGAAVTNKAHTEQSVPDSGRYWSQHSPANGYAPETGISGKAVLFLAAFLCFVIDTSALHSTSSQPHTFLGSLNALSVCSDQILTLVRDAECHN